MPRSLIALSLGTIIGLTAASVYWRGTQQRSKFLFDQNVKCRQIAKQYEAENRVAVLKVAYSPSRNSCIAEVTRPPKNGGIDFTVDDLLSGEQLFWAGQELAGPAGQRPHPSRFLAAAVPNRAPNWVQ